MVFEDCRAGRCRRWGVDRLLVAAALTAGCSSTPSTTMLEISGDHESAAPDAKGEIPFLPGQDVDSLGDVSDGLDAFGGEAADLVPTDAWQPLPCQDNGDCDSGFCLPGPNGSFCGQPCVEECPKGWVCRQFQSEPDVLFLCVWPHTSLCRPCVASEECNDPSLPAGNYCISKGEEGSFCGSQCDDALSCPDGYACQEITLEGGAKVQQCLGQAECTCSEKAIAEEAFTQCSVTNDLGSCKGLRKCTAEGLGDCDAPPAEPEACDGKDNDCDGETDGEGAQGCTAYFTDQDIDGFGMEEAGCFCEAQPGLTSVGGDCDDSSPAVFPGATEVCNGTDADCDGQIDEPGSLGCLPLHVDGDGDGYGGGESECVCPGTAGYAPAADDCDDQDVEANPGAVEACNGKDDDCDGKTDPENVQGCQSWYVDEDGDGMGNTALSACLCGPDGLYTTLVPGDCDDLDKGTGGGAPEACDSKDNDCDGVVDEADATGCIQAFIDGDKDGWGGASKSCVCQVGNGTSATGGDCDDTLSAVHPGAVEACNGFDDDCDGKTDPAGAVGCSNWYPDADGDGYGDSGAVGQCQCVSTPAFPVNNKEDCNDASADVKPGAVEACNGQDDNCDGLTDSENAQGCQVRFLDGDGDGIGGTQSACVCPAAAGYSTLTGDCNDGNAAVKPGATETCNGQDDNCDGSTDPAGSQGCQARFLDSDGDGYGGSQSECVCPATPGYAGQSGDCNDVNGAIKPGAAETCNGQDDNCDGLTDPADANGCTTYFKDGDGDGYGDKFSPSKCLCQSAPPYNVTNNQDCGDASGAVKPGAAESCNGQDDNCDGQIDPENSQGCGTKYFDNDVDGYGVNQTKCLCSSQGKYSASQAGDCNDDDGTMKPGYPEQCDSKDNDCNGKMDDNGSCFDTVYRFLFSNAGDADHFYKTDAGVPPSYSPEGAVFKVAKIQTGSINQTLLRHYSAKGTDHFYTTSSEESLYVQNNLDYVYEGHVGSCASEKVDPSMVPLYRMWSAGKSDHFYTTSEAEKNSALGMGYVYESVTCWVWPANWP